MTLEYWISFVRQNETWVYLVLINSNSSTLKVTPVLASIFYPFERNQLFLYSLYRPIKFSGYLVIESFASEDEIEGMMKRMEQLVDDFDPSSTASIFSTKNQVYNMFFSILFSSKFSFFKVWVVLFIISVLFFFSFSAKVDWWLLFR